MRKLMWLWLLVPALAYAEPLNLRFRFSPFDPAASQVKVFQGATVVEPDVMGRKLRCPTGSQTDWCVDTVVDVPRNQQVAFTAKAFNTLGEGSPASAPVGFLAPAVPGAPTLQGLQVVLP